MTSTGEPLHVSFAMTDAVISAAVREHLRALARDWFRPRHLALVGASGAIAALGFAQDAPGWLAWLAVAGPAAFAVVFVGWLGALWWMPRAAVRKIAHLPHRNVSVECTADSLAFATANERLEVAWCEVVEIRRLPNYWLFRLRAGAEIPVPAALFADDAVAAMRARISAR
jgi:hypothetical protein